MAGSEFQPTTKRPAAVEQLAKDIEAGDQAVHSSEQMEKAAKGAQGIIEAISKSVLLILKAPNRTAKRKLKAQLLRVIKKL